MAAAKHFAAKHVAAKREEQAMAIRRVSPMPIVGGLLAIVALGLVLTTASSQTSFNEREVKASVSALDKSDVYALDFRFKDPRMIVASYPGRGTRVFWYLWYQVINRTGKPQDLAPSFELVTLDNPAVYKDEVLPSVIEAIRKVEDPTGYQKIKNSVSISDSKIPPSLPPEEAFPFAVTGVAVWDASPADPKKRDPKVKDLGESASFSIFVGGLSNGTVLVDGPAPGLPPVKQHKTLQLNFRRKGDRFSVDPRDVEFISPAKWIYRAEGRTIPSDKKGEEPKIEKK
jgi:hypothetical protein